MVGKNSCCRCGHWRGKLGGVRLRRWIGIWRMNKGRFFVRILLLISRLTFCSSSFIRLDCLQNRTSFVTCWPSIRCHNRARRVFAFVWGTYPPSDPVIRTFVLTLICSQTDLDHHRQDHARSNNNPSDIIETDTHF